MVRVPFILTSVLAALLGMERVVAGDASAGSASAPVTTAPVSVRVPLIEAARRGDAKMTLTLVAGDTDLAATDSFSRTALHYAARLGHYEVTRILINAGAPLEARDVDDFTPLLRAVQGGDANAETVRLLLGAGADRDARADGQAAGRIAASVGATGLRDILAR